MSALKHLALHIAGYTSFLKSSKSRRIKPSRELPGNEILFFSYSPLAIRYVSSGSIPKCSAAIFWSSSMFSSLGDFVSTCSVSIETTSTGAPALTASLKPSGISYHSSAQRKENTPPSESLTVIVGITDFLGENSLIAFSRSATRCRIGSDVRDTGYVLRPTEKAMARLMLRFVSQSMRS